MKKITPISHFAALLIITVLYGLIYATVQQSYRAGANDPQLQIALDIKNAIEHNRRIDQWMGDDTIEISESLSVFKTLYNKNGEPFQSTGLLDNHLPKLPEGIFDFTDKKKEDVLTWQPRPGVRMAMVVESVKSPSIAFIAVGRSLKEVEKRESNLRTMILMAWFVCTGIILLHFLSSYFDSKK